MTEPVGRPGPLVRDAEPADFEAIARLTVAAYRADGQLTGESGYARILADVAGRSACLERATNRGCRGVVICTRSFSAPAQRLYARLGFVRTPERDWSPEPGVDLLALRIDLASAPAPLAEPSRG